MKARILILVLGFLFGLAAALLAPRFWHRAMPRDWRGAPTEGVVESKLWEGDRLLLTLVTPDGALLASFSQRVADIDLLVDEGDTLSLALGRYRPFVEDPEIDRVVKAPEAPEPREPEAAPEPEAPEAAPEPEAPVEVESDEAPEAEGLGPR